MNHCKTNQFAVTQGNQDPTDALSKPLKCVRYTIKNESDSTANMHVGINQPSSPSMILQPGESFTNSVDGFYIYDDIYIGWEPGMSGGKGLVLQQIDLGKEVCD